MPETNPYHAPSSSLELEGKAVSFTGYAGFWRRFFAAFIDGILIQIIVRLLGYIVGIGVGLSGDGTTAIGMEVSSSGSGTTVTGTSALVMGFIIVTIALPWLYSAMMESSFYQATLGKMVFRIKVTDLEGDRISFGRATGRHFGKYISSLLLMIGFIMAAVTDKKQALHDIMAGCLVVKK